MTTFTIVLLTATVGLPHPAASAGAATDPATHHAPSALDEEASEEAAPPRAFSALTTWHSFTNWLGDNIEMYELHLGYAITPEDKVGIKAATWKLFQPLGIPLWNPKLMDKSERYPGRLREYGAGIFYQRRIWAGLFAAIEVMPLRKVYLDNNGKTVDTGFRLYTSYHLGYHVSFLSDRIFIEPQIHCNYWPIESKGPQEFRAMDEKWNNYFLFEPNLYLGVNL